MDQMRFHILQLLIWVNAVCSGLSVPVLRVNTVPILRVDTVPILRVDTV